MNMQEVKRMYNISDQYSVFEPWLKENDFTMKDLPLSATTESGEMVIIEVDGKDENDNWIWVVNTVQENGWMQIQRYYADGTVELSYEV